MVASVATSATNGFAGMKSSMFKSCAASCENAILLRHNKTVPYNTSEWRNYYESLVKRDMEPTTHVDCSHREDMVVLGREEDTLAMPMVLSSMARKQWLLDLDSARRKQSTSENVTKLLGTMHSNFAISSDLWLPDIVHVFDKIPKPENASSGPSKEDEIHVVDNDLGTSFSNFARIEVNRLQLEHKRIGEKTFTDDTAAVVKGAILFPQHLTGGSPNCGLFEAMIRVYDVEEDGEPDVYLTEEDGSFEMALTRGKTFRIEAFYEGHTICYAGSQPQDATSPNGYHFEGGQQACVKTTHTLARVGDGNSLYFTDITRGNIDLGLYAGECEERYTGEDVKFRVTPVNGCHKPVIVSETDINARWRRLLVEDILPEGQQVGDNARVWKFAAMDYSITLASGSDISRVTEKACPDEACPDYWDGCQVEPDDMRQFFRNRNSLERLALMRDEFAWNSIRYKYHGYICAQIMDIPRIKTDNELRPETCVGNSTSGMLTEKHLLGSSDHDTISVAADKSLRVKVFELHDLAPNDANAPLAECRKFPNTQSRTGNTKFSVRQTVTNEEDNVCHPNRGGGPLCDFEVNISTADVGKLIFPTEEDTDQETTQMVIAAGYPNLANPYRREVTITVTRDDTPLDGGLGRSLKATMTRVLIPLGSKPRGGFDTGDDTLWATVPIDGLVYTVVHDPPGGNSVAELQSGSEITIQWEIASARSVKVGRSIELNLGFAGKTTFDLGFNAGYTAEAATKSSVLTLETEKDFGHKESGPHFTAKATSEEVWETTVTMDRHIRSSDDEGTPGRPGDVILGGGIELVYKVSDTLDVGTADDCLTTGVGITWLPRRPTSYVFNVFSIESQVLPNLYFLYTVAKSGENTAKTPSDRIVKDGSGMRYECASSPCSNSEMNQHWASYILRRIHTWKRTLLWSSPEVYWMPKGASYEKNYKAYDRINEPYIDSRSLFERRMSSALAKRDSKRDPSILRVAFELSKMWYEQSLLSVGDRGMLRSKPHIPALFLTAGLEIPRLAPFLENSRAASFASIAYPRSSKGAWSFDEVVNDQTNIGMYSFGMNEVAARDLDAQVKKCDGVLCETSGEFDAAPHDVLYGGSLNAMGETGDLRATDPSRLMASLTGTPGPTGMLQKDAVASGGEEETIYLTFGGGGHALEFSFSAKESINRDAFAYSLDFDASAENTNNMKFSGSPIPTIEFNRATDIARTLSTDRIFAWNKYGTMTTVYSLADPDYGDKFVLKVGSDARFGTPLFMTMGGRSMCPGELTTMWRESRNIIESARPLSFGTLPLNPGERAVHEITIQNESPYREARPLYLRIVDGHSESLRSLVRAALNIIKDDESASAQHVATVVTNTAANSVASASPSMATVIEKVEEAAGSGNATALSVMQVVVAEVESVSKSAMTPLQDVEITVNGKKVVPIAEWLPLKHVIGDALESQRTVHKTVFNLGFKPTETSHPIIEHIQVEIGSLCEMQISYDGAGLYRDPIAVKAQLEKMRWESKCPSVTFSKSTVIDSEITRANATAPPLRLVVVNPDSGNLWDSSASRLEKVVVQYRPLSGGEWITAKEDHVEYKDDSYKKNLICQHSRTSGCTWDWDLNNKYDKLLSGYKDGAYEVRVKNFCSGGDAFAATEVHEYVGDKTLLLFTDTKNPLVEQHVSSPAARTVTIVYAEEIDCADPPTFEVAQTHDESCVAVAGDGTVSAAIIRESYEQTCLNTGVQGKWMMQYPNNEDAPNPGLYRVTVRDIRDKAGNPFVGDLTINYVVGDVVDDCDILKASKDDLTPLIGLGNFADVQGNTIWGVYSKNIDCRSQRVTITKSFDQSCRSTSTEIGTTNFTLACVNVGGTGQWIMKYPEDLESGVYTVRVQGVKDRTGHEASSFIRKFTTLHNSDGTLNECDDASASFAIGLGRMRRRRLAPSASATKTSTKLILSDLAIVVFAICALVMIIKKRIALPADESELREREAFDKVDIPRYGSSL